MLAKHSGYHRIQAYLHSENLTAPRLDPPGGLPRLRTRLLRRFALSRWCVGGSFHLDRQIRHRLRSGFTGIIHYLWADRDFAFLDLLPRPPDVRLIGTFHHPPDQLTKIIRRPRGLASFDALILMSETQRSWFLDHGVPANRLHVILHGVDTDYFTPSLPLSQPIAKPFVALSVGSTGRDFPLLHAVASFFQNRSDLRFHILGPKHEAPRFANLPNVRFEFNVPDHTLLEAYQNADFLLHLTTTATANNVLVESLSCGTPVIAQSQGGIAEYVNPHCSLLAPPTGLQPVVTAIESFLTHPDKHSQMRQAAREHAESLSWPNIAAQTQALYNSLR